MSAAETRQLLADAASSVEAVTCSAYYRTSLKPGDATVRWDRTAPKKFGAIDTWQIVVVLPAGLDKAEQWCDQHADELVDAVAPLMVVTSVTPNQMILDQGATIPVLLIEGTRERE